jgi:hypothetical protein
MIHVLHIGKTGGTAIKAALKAYPDRFKLHGHSVRLSDCPTGDLVFFALRHPVDRFVSSFNSRLRKGLPRYFYDWSKGEAAAFAHFASANELAEALSSRNPLRRHRARTAMWNINHVKTRLDYWLGSTEALLSRRADLVIGETRTLQSDFSRLLRLAGLGPIDLPTDPVAAHITADHMNKHLSDAARHNLAKWYAQDLALYEQAMVLKGDVSAEREGRAAMEPSFA